MRATAYRFESGHRHQKAAPSCRVLLFGICDPNLKPAPATGEPKGRVLVPLAASSPVTGTTSEEACCVPLPRFSQEPGKLHIHRLLLPSPNRKSHGGLPIWFLYTVRIMYFLKRQKAVPPLVGDCFLVLAIPISNRPLRARLLPPLKGEVSPAQAPVTEGSPPVPRVIASQSDKRAVGGASPYDAAGRFPLCHCDASLRWQAFGLCRGAARIPIRRRRRHLNYSLFILHSSFLPRSLETPLAATKEDAIIKGNSANCRPKQQETRRKP